MTFEAKVNKKRKRNDNQSDNIGKKIRKILSLHTKNTYIIFKSTKSGSYLKKNTRQLQVDIDEPRCFIS